MQEYSLRQILTAKILSPKKTVLIPDIDAGCTLADDCPADKFQKFRDENPDHYVVSYINCSAEVSEVFKVPLELLLDRGSYSEHSFNWNGEKRSFLAVEEPDSMLSFSFNNSSICFMRTSFSFFKD